ncbi:MAG: von Willebrand factor type A domain-containing protein [Bacteroidia bacterium]|nr:von Willebrand factor type A domain-containing protein [Bacteroidia bacterium]
MKNKIKTGFFMLIAAGITLNFYAFSDRKFSCTVTGKVKDKSTKAVIAFAEVELMDMSGKKLSSAITDFDGKYTLFCSSTGTFNIRASFIGYKSVVKNSMTLTDGKTIALDFELEMKDTAVADDEKLRQPVDYKLPDVNKKEYLNAEMQDVTVPPMSSQSKTMRNGYQSTTGNTTVAQEQFNTEQYDYIAENNFKSVKNNPLSTFSIDVDAASYSNMRRFINNGSLPPVDAVRIEEMINYFTYRYPQPGNNVPFALYTESAPCPWNKDHRLAAVALQGKKISEENLPPANLVFLIDVSGSMMTANKLPLVKKSLGLLVNNLRQQDRVAITVYAGNAGLVLPSTSGANKERIMQAINALEAGGSTAGGAGIKLAYKVAKDNFSEEGNNRVILCTDGDFNVGVSSDGELTRMIEEKRGTGIFLSVLGFGTGNLKDSRMEKLADKGNGNYAYIDNIMEAKKVFVNEMGGTLMTIAKDVKIQVEFNPAKVREYKLIGYENRMLHSEDFNDDKKDAGEMGSGHIVTALYEIVPFDAPSVGTSIDALKYQSVIKEKSHSEFTDEMMTVKVRYKEPQGSVSKLTTRAVRWSNTTIENMSENLKFASAVAEFGLILRNSPYKGKSNYNQVLNLARASKDKDEFGYRSEFIRLVEAAKLLDNRNQNNNTDVEDVVYEK